MNIYTIYADVKEGYSPKDFAKNITIFLNNISTCKSFRISRMKLGFRSMDLPEFRIDMDFQTMQDLDDAMTNVLNNKDNIEQDHVAFNKMVDQETIQHFLYRDYPDE